MSLCSKQNLRYWLTIPYPLQPPSQSAVKLAGAMLPTRFRKESSVLSLGFSTSNTKISKIS